jgi:hypothetical protein
VKLRDPRQPLPGLVKPGQFPFTLSNKLGHRPVEDRVQNILFVFEIQIDGPVGDPSLGGNIRNLGIKVPKAREYLDRGALE